MNIKKIFDQHVSCRPSRVMANQHIFKSLPYFEMILLCVLVFLPMT